MGSWESVEISLNLFIELAAFSGQKLFVIIIEGFEPSTSYVRDLDLLNSLNFQVLSLTWEEGFETFGTWCLGTCMISRPTLGCGDWWILLTFLTRKHSSRMRATALLTVADGIRGLVSRWVPTPWTHPPGLDIPTTQKDLISEILPKDMGSEILTHCEQTDICENITFTRAVMTSSLPNRDITSQCHKYHEKLRGLHHPSFRKLLS